MQVHQCKNRLLIKSSTWNKDSSELLDYESTELISAEFETRSPGVVTRRGENVKFIPINEDNIIVKSRKILEVNCTRDDFFIKKNLNENQSLHEMITSGDSAWIGLRHFKPFDNSIGYKLSKGDIIKIGRMKMKIKDINIENASDDSFENRTKHFATKNERSLNNIINDLEMKNIAGGKKNESEKLVKKSKNICRICYCDDTEVDSPLIQPCLCSGTMKYIHYSCLQQWLNLKVVIKPITNENCMIYSLKSVECELCKSLLPDFVRSNDKVYEIRDCKPTFKSYISFETVASDKNATRMVYIINLDNKSSIRFGRGHDSEIRVSDISVSRYHAIIIKNKDGSVSLEDNNSKFGTLVLLQNSNLRVLDNHPLPLQIGRSFLSFTIKKPCGIFSCCNSKIPLDKNLDYQILNSRFVNFEKTNVVKLQTEDSVSESSNKITQHEDARFRVIEAKEDQENQIEIMNSPNAHHWNREMTNCEALDKIGSSVIRIQGMLNTNLNRIDQGAEQAVPKEQTVEAGNNPIGGGNNLG